MNAEIVGHMKSDGNNYSYYRTLSIQATFAVKSECTICDDTTCYHMYCCGEQSSCDVHASHCLSLCTDIVDKICYMFTKTKSQSH